MSFPRQAKTSQLHKNTGVENEVKFPGSAILKEEKPKKAAAPRAALFTLQRSFRISFLCITHLGSKIYTNSDRNPNRIRHPDRKLAGIKHLALKGQKLSPLESNGYKIGC